MAFTNVMKVMPNQFQISAKNWQNKMANSSFLFLLSLRKINRKMTQQIGEEFFFFFNGFHLNWAKISQQNGENLF